MPFWHHRTKGKRCCLKCARGILFSPHMVLHLPANNFVLSQACASVKFMNVCVPSELFSPPGGLHLTLSGCLTYLPYMGNWLAWFTEQLFRHAFPGNRLVLMANVWAHISRRDHLCYPWNDIIGRKRRATLLERLLCFLSNFIGVSLVFFLTGSLYPCTL